MILLKEVVYVHDIPKNNHIVLAGDIGGTNSNFGVCALANGSVTLLFAIHAKSKEVTDFPSLVAEVLSFIKTNHAIDIYHACFAAAGVVSEQRDFCKPTNLNFVIDAKKILKKTNLESAVIINDFEAVGYGIDYIARDDIININNRMPREHANRASLGAGTGLGKVLLIWDYSSQSYVPIPSEGGHADLSVYSELEFKFMKFVQHELNTNLPISWEHVLSGKGIVRLYTFLGQLNHYQETHYTKEIIEGGTNPDQIFKYWKQDRHCTDTFNWYGQWYARCAKNFALEALSLGGLYIAGGIAAKNIPLFENPEFMQEFKQSIKQAELLNKIPVKIIADYNVSLFGAAAYLALRK
jgi:glucokinase